MKFKIGDKVRVIRERDQQKKITGRIIELRYPSDNSYYPYGIITDQEGHREGSGEGWTKGYENRNIIAGASDIELISTNKTMAKKLTPHQKSIKERTRIYKFVLKNIKGLVKKYGQDSVRYSLNRWLTEERDKRYWLKEKEVAEEKLKEIGKKLK